MSYHSWVIFVFIILNQFSENSLVFVVVPIFVISTNVFLPPSLTYSYSQRTYEQYRQQQQQKVNDANKSNLNPTTGQTNPIVHKTSPSASPRPTSAPIKTRPVPSKLVLPPKAGGPGNPRPSSSTAGAKSSVEKPSSIRSPPPRPVVPEVLKVRSDGQSSSNSSKITHQMMR